MIVNSYDNFYPSDLVSKIDNHYPFPFLKQYADFEKQYFGSQVLIIFSDDKSISVPIKISKINFFTIAQVLFQPFSIEKNIDTTEEKLFLNQLMKYFRETKLCHRIQIPSTIVLFNSYPDGSVFCPFGTYYLNIESKSEEELFAGFRPNYRNEINKSIKEGAYIKYGETELEIFYHLYADTMKREKKYTAPFSFFQQLNETLGKENIVCAICYHNNMPEGGIFMPYTNYSAHYLYGASAENTSLVGIVKHLQWDVMRYMKSKGVKRYDFVGARLSDVSGTKLEGIQNFKARFGSTLEKGFLWKMDISPYHCQLFDTIMGVRRFIKKEKKHQDIIDQEIDKNKKSDIIQN